MAKIELEIIINASPQVVYDVSQDYSVRYLWDPFPESIRLLDGATTVEPGVRALVLAKIGFKMEVEFIQVSPPSTTAIRMTKGPFFLQSFAGSWIFKDINGATRAKFLYSVKTKKWALPIISEYLACRYFSIAVRRRLQGLKRFCEAKVINN